MNINRYSCTICNLSYSSRQNLWKHTNKKHKNNFSSESHDVLQNCTNFTQNPDIVLQNCTNFTPNVWITPTITTDETQSEVQKNQCKYCLKTYSRPYSAKRHEAKCILKNPNNEVENLKTIIKQQSEEINQMKNALTKLINDKKQPKKNSKKSNDNNINNGTIINNKVNNKVINDNKVITNNINIIKFGSESLEDLLTEKEILKILNSRYQSLEESIKTVHLNKNRPEYQNICITNLKDDLAYIYNGEQFETVSKKVMLDELIDIHTENIEVTFDNYKDKLNEKTVGILENFLGKINDDKTPVVAEDEGKKFKNYKAYKANNLKLLVYNKSSNNKKIIDLKYKKCKNDVDTSKVIDI